MSDGWASYKCLGENGYVHQFVNHSENFVDVDDKSIHTQNVESQWCAIKRDFRKKGTNLSKHIDEYLLQYMYRKMHEDQDIFKAFLQEISRQYDL